MPWCSASCAGPFVRGVRRGWLLRGRLALGGGPGLGGGRLGWFLGRRRLGGRRFGGFGGGGFGGGGFDLGGGGFGGGGFDLGGGGLDLVVPGFLDGGVPVGDPR